MSNWRSVIETWPLSLLVSLSQKSGSTCSSRSHSTSSYYCSYSTSSHYCSCTTSSCHAPVLPPAIVARPTHPLPERPVEAAVLPPQDAAARAATARANASGAKRGRDEESDELDERRRKRVQLEGPATSAQPTISEAFGSGSKRGREPEESDELNEASRKRVRAGKVISTTSALLPSKPVTLECASCGDDYDPTQLAHMECEHNYCQDCLQRVVGWGIK